MKLDHQTQMFLLLAAVGVGWYVYTQRKQTAASGMTYGQGLGVTSASQKQAPSPADLSDWYG